MRYHGSMDLFNVVIHRYNKDNLIKFLSNLKYVHIKAKPDKNNINLSKFYKDSNIINEKINKLAANIEYLNQKLNITTHDITHLKLKKKEKLQFIGTNLKELLNKIWVEVEFFINRIHELEKYISMAQIELDYLKMIKDCYTFLDTYKINRLSLTKLNQLKLSSYTSFSKNLENLNFVFKITDFPVIYQWSKISEDRIVFFIIYPKEKEEELNEKLNVIYAEEIPILKKFLTYDSINFPRIEKEIKFIVKTISKYNRELQQIRDNNILRFAAIGEVIQNLDDYNWVDQQFEEISSNELLLKFFIPSEKKMKIENKLRQEFKEKISFDSTTIGKTFSNKNKDTYPIKGRDNIDKNDEEMSEEEDIRGETPTLMSNFFLFRPFESLTKLYGTPSYSEIDPTPFLFFTFPLLFGLMFGDIGHGLCLVIAGIIGVIMFRKKKETTTYNFSWIIFWCGWGAILFGSLYGEFFGMNEIAILEIQLTPIVILGFTLQNPMDNIMTALLLAILIGVVHICFGWFLQFLNYCKHKRIYLGITDSLCKILFLVGGTCLIFIWGLNFVTWFEFPYPILFPLIPGLLLFVLKPFGKKLGISYLKDETYGDLLGEGSFETIETVLSVISNVASYIRILALALVHIALMICVREIIGLIEGEGIFFQILIVLFLIFGNLLIILLEGVLVFINSLRLHFYEFFSKFYQGDGISYSPFYLKDKYSIIQLQLSSEKDIISEEIEKSIKIKNAKQNIHRAVDYIKGKYY